MGGVDLTGFYKRCSFNMAVKSQSNLNDIIRQCNVKSSPAI